LQLSVEQPHRQNGEYYFAVSAKDMIADDDTNDKIGSRRQAEEEVVQGQGYAFTVLVSHHRMILDYRIGKEEYSLFTRNSAMTAGGMNTVG
jgi:hypothetical protein